MRFDRFAIHARWFVSAILFALFLPCNGMAQGIAFSVGPDETLTYPSNLTDLADEHTTIFPPAPGSNSYRFFASSGIKGGSGGTVVLETTDLANFAFASGYPVQVMTPPIAFTTCKTTYDPEFDLNYAAPGSVIQDPTLPPGNLIMIYEAENHCPGGVWQHDFYVTVGFARSSDNGKTWPAPVDSEFGDTDRYPVLKSSTPQPTTPPTVSQAIGTALPSAIVVTNANLESYLYVVYGVSGPGADGITHIARGKLGGSGPISFLKWYKGAFTEPGIGGRDNGVLPSKGCTGHQAMAQISYSDTLGLYVMVFACTDTRPDSTGALQGYQASWYFSTATSLDLQNWTAPQLIANSQFPIVNGCASDGTGESFDGWYPSLMSPGVAAGHISNAGKIFYMSGCDRGKRQFMSRNFTITTPDFQGVWGGGQSENGWGLAFMQHGNTLVAGWYYYGANGKATWTIMPGCTWNAAHTSCAGSLYNSTSAWLGSYNAASFNQASVGSMTLSFADANNGTMQYTVNGVSGSKTISRLSFGSGTAPSGTNYSDVWGGGAGQNGWGVVLEQEQAVMAGSWYTYNKQGQATWYLINGGSWTNATTFSAQLTSATGSPLIGTTYNPGQFAASPAGSIVFTFTDANDAAMSYTVDGVTQTKNISRLQF